MKKLQIWKNFSTTNIDDYCRCLFHNDYQCLLVAGEYDQNEALKEWEKISMRYAELVGGSAIERYKAKMKEELEMTLRVNSASVCHTVLMYKYMDASAIEVLRSFGYDVNFTPENYDDKLNVLYAKIMTGFSQLKTLRAEISKMNNDTDKPTEQQFMDYVAIISKFMGFNIQRTTLLQDFASYCRIYDAECERLNKINSKLTK